MGATWTTPPTALADAFDAYVERSRQAALSAARQAAQRLEVLAKAHAPWTDQTGNARRGLFSVAEIQRDILSIYLSHGRDVDYGKYLETRWAERYAIIRPTLDAEEDGIFRDIAEAMKRA